MGDGRCEVGREFPWRSDIFDLVYLALALGSLGCMHSNIWWSWGAHPGSHFFFGFYFLINLYLGQFRKVYQ